MKKYKITLMFLILVEIAFSVFCVWNYNEGPFDDDFLFFLLMALSVVVFITFVVTIVSIRKGKRVESSYETRTPVKDEPLVIDYIDPASASKPREKVVLKADDMLAPPDTKRRAGYTDSVVEETEAVVKAETPKKTDAKKADKSDDVVKIAPKVLETVQIYEYNREDSSNIWRCSYCDLINKISNTECSICKSARY